MATGVAVRCLARHLASKWEDPAVVVVDEQGRFAISLLSGHLGGANALAKEAARILGGQPVITTASDLKELPALDLLAVRYGLTPWPRPRLTRASACLVNGGRLGVWVEEGLPPRLKAAFAPLPVFPIKQFCGPDGWDGGVLVTSRILGDFGPAWVYFRPRNVAAGIGCHRGTPSGVILAAVRRALRLARVSCLSLACLATVDLKFREEGLRRAARRLKRPLVTFSRREIASFLAENPAFGSSSQVEKHIGVGAVCEPCAVLAAGGGPLILPKVIHQGVTVALARGGSSS
jgi:cobalt-precorrin 5A hydrolase